ncbi:hypothetical protein ACRAWD_08655 [Caulobacter segnis]
MIKPVITDGPGGLDAGRHIRTAGGNDIIVVDNGVMRGLIDSGTGKRPRSSSKSSTAMSSPAPATTMSTSAHSPPCTRSAGKATDIAVIEDFQKGFDLLSFAGAVGPGDKKQLYFVTTATFDEALTAYSGVTAANSNTVFEWNGDTLCLPPERRSRRR